jgi:serine/threonine protein kinase/WD40 repeat protein
MSDCPSDADLSGFLRRLLAPDLTERLAAHVDVCASCRDRLDRLNRDAIAARSSEKLATLLSRSAEPATADGGPSFSEAHTLILATNTPLLIPHPSGLPLVPGFDLITEIGRGGMGVVYRARHKKTNRLVALKMILAGAAADPRTVQRFLFEAEILARVQHPQVLQVYEVDTFAGPGGVPVPYLAIELLEGGSLSRRLKSGRLAPRDAAQLVEGIARAVHAVHQQGVIHRDLKPGNILFPKSEAATGPESSAPNADPGAGGDSGSGISNSAPKVTDFGLAKFIQAGADLTGSGQIVGTPHYMAPEQAAGSRQVGPAADVYSLGTILYECLTGRPPFQGDEPMSVLVKVVTETAPAVSAIRPDVPRDLGAVVTRCLSKAPHRRYATAEDMANDLRRYLENRPTKARPLGIRERFWLWTRRNPAVAGLVSALALVLVMGFAAVTWLWIEAQNTAINERGAKELAERAEMQATESVRLALEASDRATNALARLEFDRAMQWCEEGRIQEGLERFVRSVELAESTGASELARVARVNIAAWPRELPGARRAFSHAQQPRLAAFHPDGRHMVTAGRGSAVYLWDTITQTKVRTYKPLIQNPLYRITGITYWTVAISPDGGTIAAGSSDGNITVWDTGSQEPRLGFDALGRDENVWSVVFAPDGTLWANDGGAGIKRWKVSEQKPVLVAHAAPRPGALAGILQVLAISPDGARVYSGDRAGVIREWDTVRAGELRNWDAGGWIQDLALSPDGTRVAATGPEGIARVIDLSANRVVLEINLGSAYGNGIAFAHSPFLLTSDGDGNVRTWHRDTGMQVGLPIRFLGEVTKIRFRPGSDEFAVPAGDTMFLCTVPDPLYDLVSAGYGRRLRGLDLSPRGDRVAVSDDDGFELFDPSSRRRLQRVDYTFSWPYYLRLESPLTIKFDPDPGRGRVYRGIRGGFDHLAVPSGVRPQVVPSFRLGHVKHLDFLNGGKDILVADGNVVTRWSTASLHDPIVAPVEQLSAGFEIHALAARPDSREVLIAFANRVLFLDPGTLRPIPDRSGWLPRLCGWTAGDEILDARYSPDGSKVLIARRDNRAELRDARTGARLIAPLQHGRAVLAVAVSPDGRVLLTASRDGTARFWDAATGLPLGAPLRHLGPVTHAVYARNGEHVVTGTGTGHVLIWDVPPPPTRHAR